MKTGQTRLLDDLLGLLGCPIATEPVNLTTRLTGSNAINGPLQIQKQARLTDLTELTAKTHEMGGQLQQGPSS
jgi:hypothetical protein